MATKKKKKDPLLAKIKDWVRHTEKNLFFSEESNSIMIPFYEKSIRRA